MTAKHWKTFALIVVLMVTGVLLLVATSPNRTPATQDDEVTTES